MPPLALLALLVAAWEAWVRIAGIDPSVIPAPTRVAAALRDQAGPLYENSLTTLAETLIGLGLGALLGLVVAIVIAGSRLARSAVEPLLVVLQTVPPIVLAPILVLALGFGWAPRIAVVTAIVFFPVAIAAAGAFVSADPSRIDLMRSFGASRRDVLRHVTLPGAVPAIFDGVRISAAYAVAGAAISEQIGGAEGGLGLFIVRSQRSFRADQVVAAVVVIAALSVVIYAVVGLLARKAAPWHHIHRTEAP